jgi:putative phosphoribosyl transferase
MNRTIPIEKNEKEVSILADTVRLQGILGLPSHAQGVVVFAHGSGSGRFSPRNNFVARVLQNAGIATLLVDLLEESEDWDRQKVFDIDLLTNRLLVSRGGRPDLAMEYLPLVQAPTLLIIGGEDKQVISLNEAAYAQLVCHKELVIVPGATHLFEEPGALDKVAQLAQDWFANNFLKQA